MTGFIVVAMFSLNAWAAGVGLTLQGRILTSSGAPVTNNNVQFKIQIKSAGAESCLLFEESQVLDMTNSSGVFALTVGAGARSAATVDGGYSMDRIFANRGTMDFSATAPSACLIGTTYTPSVADNRKLVYFFNDGVGGWQTIPSTDINWVPLALESLQVGGYKANNLLRVLDASGNPQSAPTLLPADVTELVALLNGTSTRYVQPSSSTTFSSTISFSNAPQFSGTPTANNDLTNKSYVDTAVAGALPNVGTAGTYYRVSTDAKGRVTSGVSSLVAADIPSLDASKVTTGTFGGAVGINTSGNLYSSGTVTGGTVAATNLRIYNGANYLQVSASSMSGNLNWILPNTNGSAGQVLRTDGAGNLSWVAASTGSVTGVTATAPVVSSGGATPDISMAQATGAVPGYLSATDFNTFNNKLGAVSTFAGDVSGVYNATSVDKLKGTAFLITALTSGNFLKYNGTNWINANLSNADITTGLGYAPVNRAGDSMTGLLVLSADPSATLGSATKQYVDAVTTAAAAAYIRKDGTVTFTGPQSMGSNKLTFVTDPTAAQDAATKNYADTKILSKSAAAPAAGQNGQSLKWNDGSTSWEYFTAANPLGYTPVDRAGDTMTGALISTAGTAAAPAFGVGATTLGLFNGGSNILGISTAGTERMRVDATGNLGIGTTAPGTLLDVGGISTFRNDINVGRTTDTPKSINFYAEAGELVTLKATNTLVASETGLVTNRLKLTGGRFDFDPFASKAEFRVNGAGTQFNIFNTALSQHYLQMSANGSNIDKIVFPNGSVGIGAPAPTAALQIKAGTAAASSAPLKFTSGPVQTTPEAGAVEYDGNLYYTDAGAVRRTIASLTNLASYLPLAGGSMTGAVVSSAGTAAGPSVGIGSTSSGIFSAATNMIGLSTSGAERMRVDATGKVGISTLSPTHILDVNGDLMTRAKIYLGGITSAYIYNPSNEVILGTNGSDRMRIESGGRVYIGGGAAAVSKLDVNGNVSIGSSYAAVVAAPTDGLLVQGNVGIGTTNPATKLEVAGTVKLGAAGGVISGIGTCTIASTAWTTAAITGNTCTGVPAATAIVFCAPATAVTGQTFSAIASAANAVTIVASVAGTTALNCYWVQP